MDFSAALLSDRPWTIPPKIELRVPPSGVIAFCSEFPDNNGMRCSRCEQLWITYEQYRKIHLNLVRATKWTVRLKQPREPAADEHSRARSEYLQHIATHGKLCSFLPNVEP